MGRPRKVPAEQLTLVQHVPEFRTVVEELQGEALRNISDALRGKCELTPAERKIQRILLQTKDAIRIAQTK